jgi:hypothetical protein
MKCVMTSSIRKTRTAINPNTILAIAMTVIAICASGQQAIAAKPSAIPNPFEGAYCGYLANLNSGSMTITDSGNVSGYFSYILPNFSESYSLSGGVTADGVMRLKVVHTITLRDRGVRTLRERYSLTLNVTLNESGNLVATSGASFVLSPCQ